MHSRKGEIPIAYIIALVLGVIVLGLLAWWIFSGGQTWTSVASESVCRSKLSFYCNSWKINTYDTAKRPNGVTDFSAVCGSITSENKNTYYAPDCCTYDWAHSVLQPSCENLS